MKMLVVKISQWLICAICWVLISPLFYYLCRKWNLVGKTLRIILLMISPLFLLIYFIIIIVGVDYYINHRYDCRRTVEKMIEIPPQIHLPKYSVIEFEKGRRNFNGDHSDTK